MSAAGGSRPAGPPAGSPPGGPGRPGGGPGPGGPGGHALIMPTAKPKDFKGALRRLAGLLAVERLLIVVVVLLAVVSVTFAVLGPKILGRATDILFEGVVSQQLPAGVTQEQAIAGLEARGQDRIADMLSSMTLHPGEGVDFDAFGRTLLLLVGIYLLSAGFMWLQQYIMAGVAQRTMFGLRQAADEKLARLPLKYFDDHPRGDVLSRITNDIDNISQSLQQSLTQLISAVLTIVGVLIMMLWISWLLALILAAHRPALCGRSRSSSPSARRSSSRRNGSAPATSTATWRRCSRATTSSRCSAVRRTAIEVFDGQNDQLYEASFKAQFISGMIQPVMNFVGNLNYVAVAVVGGLLVANGRISLGDVQAFIQYSRQFTMPITQTASIMNVLQSTAASAERVFELLDENEEEPDAAESVTLAHTRGHITLRDVSFRYVPDTPLIEHLDLDVPPGQTVAIVGPTGAGKTTLVNLLLRFYELDRRRDPDRRRRRAPDVEERPAPPVRHGAAGHLALHRHDPREHRLRARGRERGGDPRRRSRRARRPLRAHPARRLRHRAGRRRDQRLPGREAAARPSRGRSSPTPTYSSSTRPRARSTRAPRC